MTSVWPARRLKSTSTSTRSAGASTSSFTGTGTSHRPPSAGLPLEAMKFAICTEIGTTASAAAAWQLTRW